MWSYIKTIFANDCPHCSQPLQSERSDLGHFKACPDGHYEEETYCHLGVRVIYTQN